MQPLPFKAQVADLVHKTRHAITTVSKSAVASAPAGLPQRIAFYLPNEPDSIQSLRRHIGEIDWLVPAVGAISGPRHRLTILRDPPLARILAESLHRPRVTMMVQNLVNGDFDSASAVALLADRGASERLLAELADAISTRKEQGVVFDFEDLPAASLPAYRQFLTRARAVFAPRGLEVSATVPAANPDWRLDEFARPLNYLFLMNYDQHWLSGTAGPIAAQDWFEQQFDTALRSVPATKLVVAIGAYGYDWHGGKADALTIEEAWSAAHDSDEVPVYDPASGNSGFAYEEDGQTHTIWMLDAAANANQLKAVGRRAAGVALWRLGSEDPGYWAVQASWYAGLGSRAFTPPDLRKLTAESLADVEGSGELLALTAQPTGGERAVVWSTEGKVIGETYRKLPTPFIVQRSGAVLGEVALTFDDGPDAEWTPKILDILAREKTPATFFVIGENAMAHPGLMRRIVAEGHELGNHSFTHPNLAEVSQLGTRLELNTTQRVIEAYTGVSTRLFRAP